MGSSKGYKHIRLPLPEDQNDEMFAIVDQVLAGSRMKVSCEDGKTRLARIPGGKKEKCVKLQQEIC